MRKQAEHWRDYRQDWKSFLEDDNKWKRGQQSQLVDIREMLDRQFGLPRGADNCAMSECSTTDVSTLHGVHTPRDQPRRAATTRPGIETPRSDGSDWANDLLDTPETSETSAKSRPDEFDITNIVISRF